MAAHVFGVRHHGPGSARSLLTALEELNPDLVLIEGPAEAEEILALAADPAMKPPVAMLFYDPAEPGRCAFYPMAEFSPEWQAMRFALVRGVPVRFMDLPQTHQLALRKAREAAPEEEEEEKEEEVPADSEEAGEVNEDAEDLSTRELRLDPLAWLARCAGYEGGERWWAHLIEERRDCGGVFPAIAEAMTALRGELTGDEIPFDAEMEARREAWMRRTIRQAEKENFQRIAVVCGAWHVPALAEGPFAKAAAKRDAQALKSLPKTKVASTWIPWTYGRMASASGYGAGVESPGWYDFLWTNADAEPQALTARWMTRAAHLLRSRDFDASTAGVIEAVRLSSSLSAIRGRALPDLAEMNEAIRAIFLMGEDGPLRLIERDLVIGDRLGEVPPDAPSVPIRQDLDKLCKSLRMPLAADPKDYDLDLRKENDLARSRLLHRLALLGVDWGRLTGARSKGTFRESWRLEWKPEFAVSLIEAAPWGNTLESAAAGLTLHRAAEAKSLGDLTEILRCALLADLAVIPELMKRIEAGAAVGADTPQMMEALPPLAEIMRYGDVRGGSVGTIAHIVRGLVERICIGLPTACAALDDDAAGVMFGHIVAVDRALGLIEEADLTAHWRAALMKLSGQAGVHGVIAGRCVRILFDADAITAPEAARRLSVALSRGADPPIAGAWIEGLLSGSGAILIHSAELWAILDAWVCSLTKEAFEATLPLVRRTFATFPAPERRMMGERLRSTGGALTGAAAGTRSESADVDFDHTRGERVLPVVMKILGLNGGGGA